MSFSADIKKQLSLIENECELCDKAQLCGILEFSGTVKNDVLKVITENENVANTITRLMKKCFDADLKYTKSEQAYSFFIEDGLIIENISNGLNLFATKDEIDDIAPNDCCKAAYIRGAFLGGGSVTDPNKRYHMEFSSKYKELTEKLCIIIEHTGLGAKTIFRKGSYIAYIKECEMIADMLGVIGAGGAALTLYNVQIEKEMRNSVNRQVNCETANLDKQIKASLRQIDAIRKIERLAGLEVLPDSLYEMAQVRLEYQDESLKELAQRMKIGKSGVNHRLNRLMEFADNLQE